MKMGTYPPLEGGSKIRAKREFSGWGTPKYQELVSSARTVETSGNSACPTPKNLSEIFRPSLKGRVD